MHTWFPLSLSLSLSLECTHAQTHRHTCAYTFLFSFCVPGPTFLSSGISWRELDINYTNHKQISWQKRRERRGGKYRNERLRSHFAPFKFIERVRKKREKGWERRERKSEKGESKRKWDWWKKFRTRKNYDFEAELVLFWISDGPLGNQNQSGAKN